MADHISTAIKALQKQVDKYHAEADKWLAKSKEANNKADLCIAQAKFIMEQIEELQPEKELTQTLT